MNLNFLNFFRALSFGGLLGGGIAGLLYLQFPHFFTGVIGIKTFVVFGISLGAGCQQLIEGLLKFVFRPISNLIDYYEKLVELGMLRNSGRLSEEQYRSILLRLTEQRFLGKGAGNIPSLPER